MSETRREALTMSLYVSLSLQAVLIATPSFEVDESRIAAAVQVSLTAIGLLLAHQVAFRLSARAANRGSIDEHTRDSVRAQFVGGVPVAFVAAAPLLVLGPNGLLVAEFLLLAFVVVVGYLSVRAGGSSRARAFVYVVGLAAVIAVVLALKIFVGH